MTMRPAWPPGTSAVPPASLRRSFGSRHGDFDHAVDDSGLIRSKRNRGGAAEHLAGAHVVRCPMQGTTQRGAFQIPLAHARERVRAMVVDCEHTVSRVAHHELAIP